MSASVPPPVPFRPENRGMGWRIAVSVVSVFGWISFLLLFLAFWAASYSGLQIAVVIVVSIFVFIGANGAAWASWGARNVPPFHGPVTGP